MLRLTNDEQLTTDDEQNVITKTHPVKNTYELNICATAFLQVKYPTRFHVLIIILCLVILKKNLTMQKEVTD